MRHKMKIYEAEKKLGLEGDIRANASIIVDCPTEKNKWQDKRQIAVAGINDEDLYHVHSILVSTSWNKNDDIFDREQVWMAKSTPKYKPTNLEHDEKQLVGGIVDCWAVDENYQEIAADTPVEELPEVYHLLVSSVIYKQWQDPQLKARAEKLISEIEANDKYVSMECIFKGFDYGVISPDGNNHVVARTEDTAFLSQFLRSYGGEGMYQDHKIGRIPKNITFSGKGFVDRPANTESIIFDKGKVFSFASDGKSLNLNDNGVKANIEEKQLLSDITSAQENSSTEDCVSDNNNIISDMEKTNMSDENRIQELQNALAGVKEENKALAAKLAEANVSKYESTIKELEASVAELQSSKESVESELTVSKESLDSAKAELSEKSESLQKIEAEMNKMKEDDKKKERKAKMMEAGMAEEDATANLEIFAEMNDEAFDIFVKTVADMHYKDKEDKDKKKKEADSMNKNYASDDSEDDTTSASDIVDEETAQAGTHSPSSENEQDEMESTRASLRNFVEQKIVNKSNK